MKTRINKEFLVRHLFALAIFAGIGLWFAYDGFVGYPATPALKLYETVEGSAPRPEMDLEQFKSDKILTQRIVSGLILLVAAGVGIHLALVASKSFEWDGEGFVLGGRRCSYDDIEKIDSSLWEKKRIFTISLKDGRSAALDAWHHSGVAEFYEKVASRG